MRCSGKLLSFLYAASLLCLASCQRDAKSPAPVSGAVFFQQRPAQGALVTFVPLTDADPAAARPTAVVDKNGVFQLTTQRSFDGAPPGLYAVTIVYLSPEKMVDDQNAGPDLLEGRYADPKTTPLRADVKAGKNEIAPFVLP